ncbi:CocE/NonD family hydrolase [Solirubrobacter soli]|uniref:CocE/NonD family hydrolase n=1 Tax=Solirubrobacter soli TaxID=363832 RepID=UPI00041AC21B|nr:CocE/NonD family hydrolase [Solirubrobacter soli]
MRGILLAVLVSLALPAAAHAQTIVDGKTAPVFDYDQAIRERVYIPNGQDSDMDGVEDRTAIEIMRPKTNDPVPVIVAPSPYYTADCGQFVGECIGDLDGDGINDRWPLWYDNYFVPRGYAVILAEMDGTANSTGCAVNGGPSDVLSIKAVVDWLQGRIPGYKAVTGTADPVVATWDNGKSAMIGRSYNGTLPNGVAATGVQGLTTIVPISAISSWYDYSRMGGVIGSTHYPAFLSNYVTDANRRAYCAPIRDLLSANDADADGTMNAFWDVRNYRPDVNKVKASVFVTHCLQDDNVKPNQFSEWWAGLAQNNVPRKLWICREGHIDPFMTRRAEWMNQLHKWFDYWLYGVQNGIMSEPRVDIEDTKDNWSTHADWPLPGSADVDVYLQGDTQTTPGFLGARAGGNADTLRWTDLSNQSEATALNIAAGTTQNNRRVFLSPTLKTDLRVSGTPQLDLRASLDKPQSNLSAMLVDYGPSTQITRTADGISTPADAPSDCWGSSSTRVGPDGKVMDYDACYQQPIKPTVTITATQGWRISRGILDSSNRDSLRADVPAVVGTEYRFKFPILPVDYTIPAGHRIGVVLMANFSNLERNGTTGTTITLNARASKITIPVVGGMRALEEAGALSDAASTHVDAPVSGTVPATLSLTLGASPSFGAFTPGVAKDYAASTTANVISSAGDAALSVSDPGHLMNGAYALPSPLEVTFSRAAWTAPVSNDVVTVGFKQHVGATDALRTGTYAKTLTFTLSTTSP